MVLEVDVLLVATRAGWADWRSWQRRDGGQAIGARSRRNDEEKVQHLFCDENEESRNEPSKSGSQRKVFQQVY